MGRKPLRKGITIDVKKHPTTKNYIIKPDQPNSLFNFKNVLRNYRQIKETLTLTVKEKSSSITYPERESEVGITHSWFTACDCFLASLYAPSVLFASIAVECVLNHDTRLYSQRKKSRNKWLSLTPNILNLARKKGLPTKLLLFKNENFKMKKLLFVQRRHQVAHGNQEGYRKIHLPKSFESGVTYHNTWRPTKEQALEQIKKIQKIHH